MRECVRICAAFVCCTSFSPVSLDFVFGLDSLQILGNRQSNMRGGADSVQKVGVGCLEYDLLGVLRRWQVEA